MKIKFICPHCKAVFQADESLNGRQVRCSKCRQIFQLSNNSTDSPSFLDQLGLTPESPTPQSPQINQRQLNPRTVEIIPFRQVSLPCSEKPPFSKSASNKRTFFAKRIIKTNCQQNQ